MSASGTAGIEVWEQFLAFILAALTVTSASSALNTILS